VSDDCPSLFIVMGYLSIFIVSFAGIWYLFLWLFTCNPCTGDSFLFIQLLFGFSLIFIFAEYKTAFFTAAKNHLNTFIAKNFLKNV